MKRRSFLTAALGLLTAPLSLFRRKKPETPPDPCAGCIAPEEPCGWRKGTSCPLRDEDFWAPLQDAELLSVPEWKEGFVVAIEFAVKNPRPFGVMRLE